MDNEEIRATAVEAASRIFEGAGTAYSSITILRLADDMAEYIATGVMP